MNYTDFINQKTHLTGQFGFDPIWMPDELFGFQRHLTEWTIRKGRGAVFADCGMGKTLMQLTWCENVHRKTGKPVLLLTPLAVGAQTVALDSGWTERGPNLGSESFVRLTLPRVAIAWDDGISQLSACAMLYVLERRIGLPVTPIRTQRLARADLSDYDVLLVPEGEPSAVLGEGGQRALRDFVRKGGVLVAVGDSLETFSAGDAPLLAVKREAALGRDPAAAGKDKDASLAEALEIAKIADAGKVRAQCREGHAEEGELGDVNPLFIAAV
jgi:hypothetical protein